MRVLSIVLACSLSLSAASVRAEPPARLPGVFGEGIREARFAQLGASDVAGSDVDLAARLQALEAERGTLGLGGPRAAQIAGGVVTGVGVLMLSVTGLVCGETWSDCNDTSNDDLFYGIGGAALTGGLLSLLVGTVVMSERKARRREIDAEILDLEASRSAARARVVGLGLVVNGRPGLSLDIVF